MAVRQNFVLLIEKGSHPGGKVPMVLAKNEGGGEAEAMRKSI